MAYFWRISSWSFVFLVLFCCLTKGLPWNFDRVVVDLLEERNDEGEGEVILDRIARVNSAAMEMNDNELETNELADITLHEGDIAMNDTEYIHLLPHGSQQAKRAAIHQHWFLWTSKVIPYEIDPKIPLATVGLLKRAMADFEEKTCLTFTPRTKELHWVRFTRQPGCWSFIGRQSFGAQNISIGLGCDFVGIIQHEILHALGFFHEQARPDRDLYVSILWENILPGRESNFVRYAGDVVSTLGLDYDYGSVMHYGKTYFTRNGKSTIQPVAAIKTLLGQRYGLSKLDYAKVNVLYDCSFHQLDSWSQWSPFSPCDRFCEKSRQRFCYSEHPGHCNGALPSGIQTQYVDCPYDECYAPVNGHWGSWSRFTPCSTSCGIGIHRRIRLCNNPYPAYGGKTCSGDDVELRPCRLRLCSMGPYDCDFTEDACNWHQSAADDFDWTRKSEGTPSFHTGPNWDHTGLVPGVSESYGYFMYVEASWIPVGYRAKLESVVIQETVPSGNLIKCLTFFYHMYGSRIGELNIYLELLDKQQLLLWKRSGDQGQQWHHGMVSFISFWPHRLVFEGVRGSSYTGDIAIDDITVKNTRCGAEPDPRSSSINGIHSTASVPLPRSTVTPAVLASGSHTVMMMSQSRGSVNSILFNSRLSITPSISVTFSATSSENFSEVTHFPLQTTTGVSSLNFQMSSTLEPTKTAQSVGLRSSSIGEGFSGSGLGLGSAAGLFDDELDTERHQEPREDYIPDYAKTVNEGSCDFNDGFCGWKQGDSREVEWGLVKDFESDSGHSIAMTIPGTLATLTSPLLASGDQGTCARLSVRFQGAAGKHVHLYIVHEDRRIAQSENVRETGADHATELAMFIHPGMVYRMIIRGIIERNSRASKISIDYVHFTPGVCVDFAHK